MSQQSSSVNAMKLDTNMRIQQSDDTGIVWYSPLELPFQIAGFGWLQAERQYRRLPIQPSQPITEAVDSLANCTSGGQIRFMTDASTLMVKVKLSGAANMNHMPATGQCGFDCYIGDSGEQFYYGTTTFNHQLTAYESTIFRQFSPENRFITLNFPLYQGVEEVWVGLDSEASVTPPPSYESNKKIILYGTSITQGGCATRPGMSYTNILSRRINMEFLNLGFSGNGKGEPELAQILSEIPDPAMLILDYEANSVSTEVFKQTLPAFISIYREKHPLIPILVISRIIYAKERFDKQLSQEREVNKQFQIQTVAHRREELEDMHIFFCDGSQLLGEHSHECTVDGVHPTDLGFLRMADGLAPVIKQILADI
ncbi:hydrolase [Paenibacillus marchantiophytorum]|uniref:Hydrolase n=1 Tax=Paenibacillus marchantiophytorum TaxID=1619310 RepID=A0ABQ2BSK0_9BACL|nr:SGNH/GDSL hydrolase family protein [Paenibacillus marchantiophytorum]GGI45181.1 hydrolase [Paenibacillus marchantiophytorum]